MQNTETCPTHWDCECASHYIHAKTERQICPVCGAREEDAPDSRTSEIGIAENMFGLSDAEIACLSMFGNEEPEDPNWNEAGIASIDMWDEEDENNG